MREDVHKIIWVALVSLLCCQTAVAQEPQFFDENGCDYLIICAPDFEPAADALARWRELSGLRTKVVNTTDIGESAENLENYINQSQSWPTAPGFVILIGDAEYIPCFYILEHALNHQTKQGTGLVEGKIASDRYYGDIDDNGTAEIYVGRLPVNSLTEAQAAVNRIIDYERNPPDPATNPSYYNSTAIAGYFQDTDPVDGHADKRFARTADDVARYLENADGCTVSRIFNTGATVTPTNWYSGTSELYLFENDDSSGLPLPPDLLKPGFAWDGSETDISIAINNGVFFAAHRGYGSRLMRYSNGDTGYYGGWRYPDFLPGDAAALTNGPLLPIVFSPASQTAWFDNETDQFEYEYYDSGSFFTALRTLAGDESFSEQLMINPNGGAIAVFGPTRTSYSGHSDRLIWGWMDAIWPDFIEYHGGAYGGSTAIYQLGPIFEYGKEYMLSKFSYSKFSVMSSIDEFVLLGDPAMEIRTYSPRSLFAGYEPTISVGNQEDFAVSVLKGVVDAVGARVTISNPSVKGDYWSGLTDNSGEIVFSNLSASTPGIYSIVVCATNAMPYEGIITAVLWRKGYIKFERDRFSSPDTMTIEAGDIDLWGTGSLEVTIVSAGSDSEICTLYEKPFEPAIFSGSISTIEDSISVSDGFLQVAHGETITVLYYDSDDGNGDTAIAAAEAEIDCVGPVVSQVNFNTGAISSASITFSTDEPAQCTVLYGLADDELNDMAGEFTEFDSHSIELSPLIVDSTYFVKIFAKDIAGNVTVDDNGGEYFTFTIPNTVFFDDFPTGKLNAANWTQVGGAPTVDSVGMGEPSGQFSLRFNGDHIGGDTVISRVLDLSGATEVELRYSGQRTGGGESPEDGDDLIFDYLANDATWKQLQRLLGSKPDMTIFISVILTLPQDAHHDGFRLRIRNIASPGLYDDWFLDDISIQPVPPRPPIAYDGEDETIINGPVAIDMIAVDDGRPYLPGMLSYIVTELPLHGTISDTSSNMITTVPYTLLGNSKRVIYTPGPDFTGIDTFSFKADDGGIPTGGGESNEAAITIMTGIRINEYQVPTGTDDCYAYGAWETNNSEDHLKVGLRLNYNTPFFLSGMRFTNIEIPRKAIVLSAYLKIFSYDSEITNAVYANIRADDSDNATNFSIRHIYQAPKTSAKVTWDHSAPWDPDTWYTSGDISSVIQEVVDRPGWRAGNSMAVYYGTRADQGGYRYFSAFERGPSMAPKLVIKYLRPGPAIYVDDDATDIFGSGRINDPFRKLEEALDYATNHIDSIKELRVAQGVYTPADTMTDRTASFLIPSGLTLYGGFNGGDTDPLIRDPVNNLTILSGDLGGDDLPGFGNIGDNAYHVVKAIGCDSTTIIDGFTISGGNASGASPDNNGGGVYIYFGSPIISNCIINLNKAAVNGGGIYLDHGSPEVVDSIFSANHANTFGGGIFISDGSPKISRTEFRGNSATMSGGAIYLQYYAAPTMTNSLFESNSAIFGGGVFCSYYSVPEFINCTFGGNSAIAAGSAMYNDVDCTATITNCIIWNEIFDNAGSLSKVTFSNVMGGWPGTGNIDSDPLFSDTDKGDLRLAAGSPCIDSGDRFIDAGGPDLDGNLRSADSDDTGGWDGTIKGIDLDSDGAVNVTWTLIDMGAYELQPAGGTFDTFTLQAIDFIDTGPWSDLFSGWAGNWSDTTAPEIDQRFYRVFAE
jgi:predicted outer membrane repeat protein